MTTDVAATQAAVADEVQGISPHMVDVKHQEAPQDSAGRLDDSAPWNGGSPVRRVLVASDPVPPLHTMHEESVGSTWPSIGLV